jgi:hypothetical protein
MAQPLPNTWTSRGNTWLRGQEAAGNAQPREENVVHGGDRVYPAALCRVDSRTTARSFVVADRGQPARRGWHLALTLSLLAALVLVPGPARALPPSSTTDEPMTRAPLGDEPGPAAELQRAATAESGARGPRLPAFRLELAFGYNSLLVDPDVGHGFTGGLYFAWGLHRRVGAELSVAFSKNPYEGLLATLGADFWSGNITAGPIVQLTRPGSRISVTIDTGMGVYLVAPILQESVWTFGLSMGLTASIHLTRWLGLGVKCRYHLFNLANLSDHDLRDPKALMKVGVVDRLEIPVYLAFYF